MKTKNEKANQEAYENAPTIKLSEAFSTETDDKGKTTVKVKGNDGEIYTIISNPVFK